ncbi:MAG TPA: ATP-binding protein [Gemmatimonadales bacterium]|nr:ATP-binding protein [Gemmatimonadales bacterium]
MADSIRGRLAIASATVGSLLILSGAVGWLTSSRVSGAMRQTLGAVRAGAALASEFAGTVAQEMEAGHAYVDTRDRRDRIAFERLSRSAHRTAERMNRGLGQSPDETALIARIDQSLAVVENHYARAHRLADIGRVADARREAERAAPLVRGVLSDLQQLSARTAGKVAEVSRRLENELRRQRWQQVIVIGGFVLVGLVLFRAIGRSISQPLEALAAHARKISSGDFRARTPAAPLPQEFRALAETMNREAAALEEFAAREARLRESEKHAAVGQLVSGVAHELSDPIAGILLRIERILDERPNDPRRKDLEEARDHALRARRIVRDLLAFVRNRYAAREPASLHDLVSHALAGISDALRRRGVTIVNTVPRSLHRLMVDRVGIEQVITNLVLNAAQAAGPGGRVRLGAESTATGAILVVEDSGPGIAPEVMPRIFEPFFTTRSGGDGPGLGLSAALGIVQQHGGTIRVENGASGSGTGARFLVDLPCAFDAVERAEPVEQPRAASGPRALVVNADPVVRAALRRYFTQREWELDETRDLDEAFRLLAHESASHPYEVIVADSDVEHSGSPTPLDRLTGQRPDVVARLVVLAPPAGPPEQLEALEKSGVEVLPMPLDLQELDAAVRRVAGARA